MKQHRAPQLGTAQRGLTYVYELFREEHRTCSSLDPVPETVTPNRNASRHGKPNHHITSEQSGGGPGVDHQTSRRDIGGVRRNLKEMAAKGPRTVVLSNRIRFGSLSVIQGFEISRPLQR
jgi:hypothetical protein